MSDRPQTRMVFHFPPPPPGAGAGAYPSPSPSGSNVSARSGQTRNGQFYPSMISPSSQGSTSDSPSIGQSVYNSPGGSPHGGSGYHPETVLSYGMERFAPAKPKEPCDAEGKHVPFEPELVYLTDATGVFQMVEDDQWNKFIDENCAHPLPAHISRFAFPSIINRSLFELISEPKVQHFFRHLMTMVISGAQKRWTYQWFCDSPEYERKMSMTISRVAQGDGKRFVLWTSRILWEKPHAFKANYLGCPDRSMASSQDLAVKPVRTVCSYCKRVLVSRQEIGQLADMVLSNLADSGYPLLDEATKSIPIIGLRGKLGQQIGYQEVGHVWLTPTQYAQAFLSDDIIINHGLCELCYREIVFHFYPEHLRGTLVLDGAAMSPPSVYIVG